jgi:hypothetical protein
MQTHGLGSAIDKTKATPKKNPLKAGFFWVIQLFKPG